MEEKKNFPSEGKLEERTEEEILIAKLKFENKQLEKELEIIKRELELCHEETMKQ